MFLTRNRVELATSVIDLPELSSTGLQGQLGALLSIKVFKCKPGDIINLHESYAACTLHSPPSLQSVSMALYEVNILLPVSMKFALNGVDHNYPYIFIHIQYVLIFTFIFSWTSKYMFNVLYCLSLVGAPHSKRSHGTPIFL